MPRKPSVNYWPSRKGYGCWFKDEQVILATGPNDAPTGPTFLAALGKFKELLSLATADRDQQDNTVAVICELYARYLEAQGRKKSLTLFKDTLTSGVERFGQVKIKDLRPLHVQQWLDEMTRPRTTERGRVVSWGVTMRRMALKNLKTALNWAQLQGYIGGHCLQVKGAIKLPRAPGRGRQAYLEPGEVVSLLGSANARLRVLLAFLNGTGARPGEAYHVEARHYCRADACLILPHNPPPGEWIHKTAARTGKDRVIFLTPDMVRLVEVQAARHATGAILRNRYGKPWNDNTVAMALRALAAEVGIDRDVTAYSFRHSFATRWLLQAGSIKVLAELLGTSVEMIEKHYGHIDIDRRRLRQLLCGIMSPAESGSAGTQSPSPSFPPTVA